MSDQSIRVQPDVLQDFVFQILKSAGMKESDALFSAECLVRSNLWGVASHGVLRLGIYTQRLKNGAINPDPRIKTIKGSGALEVMDGDNGMGYVVGREAMLRAMELARKNGVAAVGAIRSNHYGAAGLYTRMAADRGMIGISMTNVAPNVALAGAERSAVGNNPIAISVPTYGEFPFMLDIAMSAVAAGKILLASKKNEKIPLDWATDGQGRPTDDPDKGFQGFLLPMAGHKGFGLALVVDILSGVITGGAFLDRLKRMYREQEDPSLTCHFMIVIDPAALLSPDEMKSRMEDFTRFIKSVPMWDASKEMLLPGELEYRNEKEFTKNGIPIPINLYNDFKEMSEDLRVPFTLPQP